jgi:alanyl-tRNA synthetase
LRNLVVDRVPPVDKAMLRQLADSHKERLKSGVVLLASATEDGKVSIVVSVSKDLAGRVHAGQIAKQLAPIVGGSGGGRPDFAEAGGKDASGLDELLIQGEKLIQGLLETAEAHPPAPNP